MGNTMNHLSQFLSGTAMFGALVSGVYFFKFWKETRDRLFLWFGVSFCLMAVERIVLAMTDEYSDEGRAQVYLFRLAAFLMIAYAIADKNRTEKRNR